MEGVERIKKAKQIVIYFTNGNMVTIKDKEPFNIYSSEHSVCFRNDSYSYEFNTRTISGLGFKFLSDETEDTDDGK